MYDLMFRVIFGACCWLSMLFEKASLKLDGFGDGLYQRAEDREERIDARRAGRVLPWLHSNHPQAHLFEHGRRMEAAGLR